MEQQDYVTAIGMFQGAVEAGERLAESYRAVGIAYLESSEYDKAAEAFQNSRDAMEHKHEAFQKDVMFYQAQALQLAGNTDDALSVYDQMEEEFPGRGRLFFERLPVSETEGIRQCQGGF